MVLFLLAWNWLYHDSQRFPDMASYYGGFGLFVLWPLLLPMYIVETRGWRRAVAGLLFGTVVWLVAGFAGTVAGILAAAGELESNTRCLKGAEHCG